MLVLAVVLYVVSVFFLVHTFRLVSRYNQERFK